MKKILSLALCCAVALMCLTGCAPKEKLALTADVDALKVGESVQLDINKEGATFSVSDETIATVTDDGTLTAVAEGEVDVTATLKKETSTIHFKVEAAAEIEGVGENAEGAGTVVPDDETEVEVSPAPEVTEEPDAQPTPEAKPTEKPAEPVATPKPTATPKPEVKPTEKPAETPAPHTHSWSNATCTQSQKCSCGATNGSALGHAWKDATYEAPKTCTRCGATEGSAIPKPTPEPPKCGAVGHSSEGTCGVCGATYVKPAPTCATCGSTEHTTHPVQTKVCATCGGNHDYCSDDVRPQPGGSSSYEDVWGE